MDKVKRDNLIAKIMRQYDEGVSPPVIEIDDFFDGNWDDSSIAPNRVGYGHPGLKRFWDILRSVRDRENVDHVLVGIHECPEADEPLDADIWPSVENVYIYTTASPAEVSEWVAELHCDGVGEGWPYGVSAAAPKPRPGYKVRTLFWD